MDKIETLHTFQQLKILADTRRLDILRRFMAEPATLTQLGLMINKSPGWVRHHLKILETAGLVETAEKHTVARGSEKYYRARASALVLQELILPYSQNPVIIFSGSQDIAVEHITSRLAPAISLLIQPNDSLDSLINLRQGLCQVAGITHPPNPGGEYSTPFIRDLFLGRVVSVITLAHRTQGLIVAPGNPKGLKTLLDLARDDVTLINRNLGSGTRLWLDQEFTRLGLPSTSIRGYQNSVNTHSAAAKAVQAGEADVAIGLEAAACETQSDFIALFEERYALVIPIEQTQLAAPLLDYIHTSAFRKELSTLRGYNTSHSGEQIPIH